MYLEDIYLQIMSTESTVSLLMDHPRANYRAWKIL